MQRGVKHDTTIVDYEPVHFLKPPKQSVIFPRNDKVNIQGILHEIQENPDNYSDYLRYIPGGANVGNSISYGTNLYSNSQLKGRRNHVIAKEPGWEPAGGIRYDLSFLQIPEEYYSLLNLRRPDTSIEGRQEATVGQHIPRPDIVPTKVNNLSLTIMPSVVYDHKQFPRLDMDSRTKDKPQVEVTPSLVYDGVSLVSPQFQDVTRFIVYKPNGEMWGMNGDHVLNPDGSPNQMIKYVNAKDVISYLTPIFSTVVKVGDVNVPIQLKEPTRIIQEAQAELPISIPLPSGEILKLKDYTFTIFQPNMTAPAILTVDITPSVRDKPDIAHLVQPLLAGAYSDVEHREVKPLDYNRDPISFEMPIKNPYAEINQPAPTYQERQSKPYSNYDGAYSLIPGVENLMEFDISFNRKQKVIPNPNKDTLMYGPWFSVD